MPYSYINAIDGTGSTAINLACKNGHADCLKLLISGGAECTLLNKIGEQPIQTAARHGKLDCMQPLLDRNLQIDWDGSLSPLQLAKYGKHQQVVAKLNHYLHQRASTKCTSARSVSNYIVCD